MHCDYGSRHPNPICHISADEQDRLGFDNGKDIYVRKIIDMENSPNHVPIEQIQRAANNGKQYQDVIEALRKGNVKPPNDTPYRHVWCQLSVIDNLIYNADKIVIPDGPDQPGATNLQTKMLDIAHEGHPGQSSMKRFMHAHVWFPYIDQKVAEIVQGCLQCQAAIETKHRGPLIPTKTPEQVWQNLDADHW